MNSTVQKWGNSLALRIPKSMAKDIHLHQGSVVEILVVGGKMEVKPEISPKPTLAQLLQGITKKNLHSSCEWGAPVGKEAF